MLYRRPSFSSMWNEMDRLQREINRLFDVFPSRRTLTPGGYPAMNIYSNTEGVVVTAELPGVDIKDIEIQVVGDSLSVSGKREIPTVEGASYHRQERLSGSFSRTIRLPFPVETEQVDATLQNGNLVIKLPRQAASKPKKISVRSVA